MEDFVEMLKLVAMGIGLAASLPLIGYILAWLSDLGLVRSSAPPMVFDRPGAHEALAASTAVVERRAAEVGLVVRRYTPVLKGTSFGELSATLPDGGHLSLEFSGELAEISRVTLTGLLEELSLSRRVKEGGDYTGDARFDARFSLEVRLWLTRGCLGADARRALIALDDMADQGGGLNVRAGSLKLKLDGQVARDAAQLQLSSLVHALRALYGAMKPQPMGEGWLIAAARSDPDAGARARAISLLTEVLPSGPTLQVVEAALGDRSAEVRLQAALALKNTSILNDMLEADLRRAASRDPLRVLKGLEAARAEDALALLLAQEDEDVQTGAAEALGRIGTVGAVEPLRALAERGLLDSASKRAARQAILNIQSRLQGAEAGQIAVIEEAPQAGAVALADERGQLSVAARQGARPAQPS